jgi:hypothetical protein
MKWGLLEFLKITKETKGKKYIAGLQPCVGVETAF